LYYTVFHRVLGVGGILLQLNLVSSSLLVRHHIVARGEVASRCEGKQANEQKTRYCSIKKHQHKIL